MVKLSLMLHMQSHEQLLVMHVVIVSTVFLFIQLVFIVFLDFIET